MQHRIAGDGVYLTIGPAVGIHRSREVGLLVQDVIPLKHHGELLATQETMRDLSIPDEFVGVEGLVAITALAEHVDIGGNVTAPREGDSCVSTIREVPCCQVARCLQTVLCMCVGCVGIERKIEPLVAEAERCRRRNVDGVCDVTVGNGRTVQVDITHAMIVASTHRAAHVPAVQRVETDVERCTSPCVPVAVDVLRPRDASTRCFVVSDNSTDGIARALEAGIGAEAPVALRLRNGIA